MEIASRKPDQSGELRPIEKSKRKDGKGHRRASGINKAASDLGVPATNLKQSVRIASLSEDAKDVAKQHGLGNNQPQYFQNFSPVWKSHS